MRDGRQVYRPVFPRVLLGVLAAFAVWWDVDLVLNGHHATAALVTLWSVAAFAALAALFWRPAVVVDDEGVELRNVLRDVRVPWSALEAVETRFALTLVAGGRRHESWAATTSGRPPRRRPSELGIPVAGLPLDPVPSSRHPRTASGAAVYVVEERWQAWRHAAGRTLDDGPLPGAGPVVVRWRPWTGVTAVAAAGLAAALSLLIG